MKTFIRLNKYLADHGYCSRREADRLIKARKVKVNGQIAELGERVDENKDHIEVEGRQQKDIPKPVYILLNKPVGIITTTDTRKPDNVISLINQKERLFPIGRLDVKTSGLLLLTNDGQLANRLTHPRFEHEKEYEVRVDKPISDKDLKHLEKGVQLADGMTAPARTKRLSENTFLLTLREGRNRQVRRMCDALHYETQRLKRIRMSSITLGPLKVGKFRHLTKEEVCTLKQQVGLS